MRYLFWKRLWARRGFRTAVQLVILFLILIGVRAWTQRDLVGGTIPPLQGRLLDGSEYRLGTNRTQPVLLHFWASWCPVCELEEDTINALHQDYPVITVAMQSGTAGEVRAFMQAHGLNFAVINDSDGALARRFGVRAVPTSFIIDVSNQIVFRETGYTTSAGLRLRLWLAR